MPPKKKPIKNFIEALGTLEGGDLNDEITKAQKEVLEAMTDAAADGIRKPKGQITIILDMEMEDNVVKITGEVKGKKPKVKRRSTLLWVDDENNLTRTNPRQDDMFEDRPARQLRAVETETE